MKHFGLGVTFLLLTQFTYGQSTDSSQNDEMQKVLEQQLFPGSKLSPNFRFSFPNKFSELNIKTQDGYKLNGLLFKAKQSKGVIFYLHGSNDALNTWGKIAPVYLSHKYDVFILDYRGYGKSEGKVTSEKQLYGDVQATYNKLKQVYL